MPAVFVSFSIRGEMIQLFLQRKIHLIKLHTNKWKRWNVFESWTSGIRRLWFTYRNCVMFTSIFLEKGETSCWNEVLLQCQMLNKANSRLLAVRSSYLALVTKFVQDFWKLFESSCLIQYKISSVAQILSSRFAGNTIRSLKNEL